MAMAESCYIEQRDEERFVHTKYKIYTLTHSLMALASRALSTNAWLYCFGSGYDCAYDVVVVVIVFFSLFHSFVRWLVFVSVHTVVVVAVAAAVFSFILFVQFYLFQSFARLFSISLPFPLVHTLYIHSILPFAHTLRVFMCSLVLYVRYACACPPAHPSIRLAYERM